MQFSRNLGRQSAKLSGIGSFRRRLVTSLGSLGSKWRGDDRFGKESAGGGWLVGLLVPLGMDSRGCGETRGGRHGEKSVGEGVVGHFCGVFVFLQIKTG